MAPNTTFESPNFNSFIVNGSLNDNSQDPDANFFLNNVSQDFTENSVSVLHLNIRSLNKNFESFAELYISLSFNFSIICFSETWSNDENLCKNSLFQLESHSFLHKNRKYRRGGEKWKAIESLSTEISNNFLNTEGQSPHCISNFLDKLK